MIRERSIPRRRAVALLAVLACVLLASSAVVASVRMVTVSTISGRQSDDHFATVELLTAVRSACVQWIQRRSSAAVVADTDLMWSGGIAVFEDTGIGRNDLARQRCRCRHWGVANVAGRRSADRKRGPSHVFSAGHAYRPPGAVVLRHHALGDAYRIVG